MSHTLTIVMSSEYFGSDVVWSSTEGGGGVSWSQTLLTHAIVSQLNVAIDIQQNIVQFQIPVHHTYNNNHTPSSRTPQSIGTPQSIRTPLYIRTPQSIRTPLLSSIQGTSITLLL